MRVLIGGDADAIGNKLQNVGLVLKRDKSQYKYADSSHANSNHFCERFFLVPNNDS